MGNEGYFSILNQRAIIDILIGDTLVEDKGIYQIIMPYMSGSAICDLSTQFGYPVSYSSGGGAKSRWVYMQDLLKHVISNNNVSNVLSYLFDFKRFDRLKDVGSVDVIESAYKIIVKMIIEQINRQLFFSKKELKMINNKFIISNIGEQHIIEAPAITIIDVPYVRGLPDRIKNDIDSNNYDSVITKSRTLIEEVLISILEKKGTLVSTKGDLMKLYQQVKNTLEMAQSNSFDKRVNNLLSGLEKIIQSITEMRNANSDAHGVGSNRINIRKHEAQLVVNTAMTFCEYILSVFSSKEKI